LNIKVFLECIATKHMDIGLHLVSYGGV